MAPVVLILGEERFLARQAAERAVAESGLEATWTKGDEAKPGAVLDEVRTPTLLGTGRAVVVEKAEALLTGDALAAFARYAEAPNPDALLVLQAGKLDGRLKGVKALKAAAEIVACEPVREWEVDGWIGDHARSRLRLQVAKPAAQALRERVGEDLGALDGALRRLKEQIAPRTRLDVDDVLESTEDHRSPALFEASNAVEAGDRAGALRAVAAAFTEGVRMRRDTVTEAPGVALILLGQLHNAYGKLLKFHLARDAGLGDQDAAKEAGVSPRAARFFLERARRHRLPRLLARHTAFVEADRRLKRGRGAPQQALERLVLAIL